MDTPVLDDRLGFPDGFLWGTATSAHQVEGGNTNNDWWAFEQRAGAIWHGDRCGDGCGWWQDAEGDLDLMARMGQNSHRLSVEWSRIEPDAGTFDQAAIGRYRELLVGMRDRGIEPMVTLHHFTTPLWMAQQGGWSNRNVIERFRRFVAYTVDALGDLVRLWCTINEPAVYATEAYLVGIHAPGHTNPREALVVLKHMLAAHAVAYEALHRAQPEASVGLVKNIRLFDPANPRKLADHLVARFVDYAFNEMTLLSMESGRPAFPINLSRHRINLADSLDFIGLNYYTRDLVALDLKRPSEMFLRRFPTPGAEISDIGREGTYGEVYPEGMYRSLSRVARFGKPIYITEVGLPDADDDQRPRFLLTHLAQVHRAIADGMPVCGFYHWSLLDNFEWSEGWDMRFGLVSFDQRTGERRIRRSGELYTTICQQNAITQGMIGTCAPEVLAQVFRDRP